MSYADIVAVVKKLAPHAQSAYVNAFAQGQAQFEAYGVKTNLRMTHFLAQIFEETGGLVAIREDLNYTAASITRVFGVGVHSAAVTPNEAKTLAHNPKALAERVYGLGDPVMAKQLGNTEPGDGYKFRGNGPMQNTGRWWHKHVSDIVGVDFCANPDLLSDPKYILIPALEAWKAGKCNELADLNRIREITKFLNGGYNGYAHRVEWFNKIWAELGTGTPSWETADVDAETLVIQKTLIKLGYDIDGGADGKYGPATSAAVRDFQEKNHLPATGVVDATTSEMLAAAPERDGSKQTVPAPPVVSDKTVHNTGVSTVVLGGLGQSILHEVQTYMSPFADIGWLKITFGVMVLVGIILVALPALKGLNTKPDILQ